MQLSKVFGTGWAFVALSMALTGCNGSGDDDDEATEGRGTEACRRWQSALCDFVQRCGSASSVAKCQAQAPAIPCASDEAAESCVDTLAEASCSDPPTSCDIIAIADPAPAIAACSDLIGAVCDRHEKCVPGARQVCVDGATLNCNLAVGVKLSYEQCMSEIPSVACDAYDAPPSCDGVILSIACDPYDDLTSCEGVILFSSF